MIKLSIIMPVYNEEKTVKKVIDRIKKIKLDNIAKEIIVVDDCSKDNTSNILKNIKGKSIRIFHHRENMGKGAAIRTALKNCTGDIILIQDADLEYNPNEYKKLLKPILQKNADVVYGSRLGAIRKNPENLIGMYKLHYIGNLLLTFFTNLLYNSRISDMETGYKVFRKNVIGDINLRSKRFDFEPEITAKILKKNFKIHEVPIIFTARKFKEGKKITLLDGIRAAYYLLKYRFLD